MKISRVLSKVVSSWFDSTGQLDMVSTPTVFATKTSAVVFCTKTTSVVFSTKTRSRAHTLN